MSGIIASTFRGIYNLLKFIAQGWVLKRDIGARFATRREIYNLINSSHKGVLVDGKNRRLSVDMSVRNVGIFSPPGGGKTSGYIVPNILDRAKFKCSMLITDPSGEIYKNTSQYLKKKGFNILTLDPLSMETSSYFNPFEGLGKSDIVEIESICASIVMSKYGNDKEAVWNEGAISLLEVFAKCLAYSQPEHLSLPNLNYLLQQFGENGADLDKWVAYNCVNQDDRNDKSVFLSWYGITTSNPGMLSSYVTIARTALKQFNNNDIKSLFSSNDFDFDEFRKTKTAIYIKLSESQAAYYQFVIDIFYVKFFSEMMKGEPDPRKLDVYCFLDEFGNSYINNFSMIINNIRKYRVSLSLVFQGISQIDEKYGEKKAKSIKAGISTSLIYGGADNVTTEEFSKKIGEKVLQQKRNYEDADVSYARVPLMSPDKIRTLPNGKALLLSSNQPPFILDFKPYFKSGSPFKGVSKKGAYARPTRPPEVETEVFSV